MTSPDLAAALERIRVAEVGLQPMALQGNTNAIATCLRLTQRRATLLGLDMSEGVRLGVAV